MTIWLTAAAGVAIVTFAVHTFVGGRFAARPLLASDALPKATVWLNYMCWHMVTVLLAIMAATLSFGVAGLIGDDALVLIAIVAGSSSLVSIAVTLKAGIAPWRFPASYLLAAVAVLTALGILYR